MSDQHRKVAAESDKTRERNIVAIGEVLWDIFPTGPRFGGAPANFACIAAALSADPCNVVMVSAIGKDELGASAVSELASRQVDTSLVTAVDFPTGQVHIELDESGSASYRFEPNCAWDNLPLSPETIQAAEVADAVCFGTLGLRGDVSAATIQRFVAATRPNCLRICDINIRAPYYNRETILRAIQMANVLKLNDEELPLIAKVCGLAGSETEILRSMAEQFELQAVALTRGAKGAVIVRSEEVSDCAGVPTEVVDTVGAGDAFTATLAYGLLAHDDVDQINQHACEVAAYVCSQAGATPNIPSRFAVHKRNEVSLLRPDATD